jgi:anti-anti-sigma factor
VIDVEGARAPIDAVPVDARPDRCPFSRGFTPEFAQNPCCPSFQAATFTVADLRHQPLRTTVTCAHLTVGNGVNNGGRFYPRCSLGSADERLRWLATVGTARLEVVRSLEEEFEAEMAAGRERLLEAKVRALEAPIRDRDAEAELESQLTAFVETAAAFISKRAVRFADAGLPPEQLSDLLSEWASAWARIRDVGDGAISDLPLTIFAHESGASVLNDGGEHPMAATNGVTAPAMVLEHTADPGGLRVSGNVDVSNSTVLEAAVAAAAASMAEVTVDFSGILFCDLSGLRALVQAAAQLDGGRVIRVVGMPDHLHRATRLAGWARLPGLVIEP